MNNPPTEQHAAEVAAGERFRFGANWARFLTTMSEARVAAAEASLREMLGVQTLAGKRFLDIGSGSGLFSLAARRLGAQVHSLDYDPMSVACASELKRRYFADDAAWTIEEASVLDSARMRALGTHDVVYSWGVLHHTGRMYLAFENVVPLVAPGGSLFIAIYNDQGATTRYWTAVKRLYNANVLGRVAMTAVHAPYLAGLRWAVRALTHRGAVERGMTVWYDMFDWLGGYPFEVARPEEVFRFFYDRGFVLEQLRTCGGRMGCNEFVFRRS
jgi:2-polyprenyl-3-methyl-5-hydroxy-6-metoxy-1,4-benzoquinol methylase